MRAWVAGLLAAALVGACSHDDSLKRVQARGELVVVSRNGPTTWYEGPFGPEGLEYTLASRFAEHLGVRLRMVQADSIPEMFAMVQSGRADLAAAGITVTPERQKFLLFGAPYLEVREMVVCRRGGVAPRSLEDLEKQKITLVVAAGTSYVGTLAALRRKHPKLAFVVDEDNETVDLLRMVWERKIPCTVADSTIADAVRRFLPELAPRFALTEPRPIAWAFAPKAKALRDAAARWIEGLRASGALARIRMRYFGHLQMFDYVDTRRFLKATVRRLPPLRPIFEAAAKQTGFPWTLLAAQAWVESQWDPYATSPTGVRGIMMLTRAAAQELGVSNRLDPKQSIMGGARYLWRLHRRLADMPEPDRTWAALAAYNMGFAHLEDLRAYLRRQGKDASRWPVIAEHLPLLMKRRVYRQLPHGYGNGLAARIYVRRIRYYFEILDERERKTRLSGTPALHGPHG